MKTTAKTFGLALITSATLVLLWLKLAPFSSSSAPPTLFSPTPSPAAVNETKENSGGNVTVTVTPTELRVGKNPQFEVVFETHSVELDFDISQVTGLTDAAGNSYGLPSWDGTPPGGHHRRGNLVFEKPLAAVAGTVTLIFANLAGVRVRSFAWEIKP